MLTFALFRDIILLVKTVTFKGNPERLTRQVGHKLNIETE